jgi:hypothetical protein
VKTAYVAKDESKAVVILLKDGDIIEPRYRAGEKRFVRPAAFFRLCEYLDLYVGKYGDAASVTPLSEYIASVPQHDIDDLEVALKSFADMRFLDVPDRIFEEEGVK